MHDYDITYLYIIYMYCIFNISPSERAGQKKFQHRYAQGQECQWSAYNVRNMPVVVNMFHLGTLWPL